ncbi:oxidoreductase NAD binding domain containing 1 [Rhinolophus ferrumequinum]|uniref:Oxidoreductase NAD binding domain containing 1 n=1 Tax=Rhinolophus ferrumequinum TaxID=59479 RepID=A0A7J7UK76_RHIFE|nr:oxidoreductase NAD binding domain containing 1 [Rhinolophus ferrumequinum]
MGCAAVMIPGLLRGPVGAICTQAASLRSTCSTVRHLSLTSVMKSKRKTDHLERTANIVRREVVSAAKVCGAASESPSVKRLRLLVADKDFSFKAGQWYLSRFSIGFLFTHLRMVFINIKQQRALEFRR